MPEGPGRRLPGLSIRMKLTLSYTGFLVIAGAAPFAVLLLVLRYLPDDNLVIAGNGGFVPNRSDLLEVAKPLFAGGIVFLAVVGFAGGWFLSGRMLRPLQRISDAARSAAQGSLAHRIDLDGRDDELRQLADTFDQMLERLETAFEEQRRFTANASHELRTPHAVVRTMLEVARADPEGRDVEVLLGRLQEMNERSITALDALLQLARAGRDDLRCEPCDLVGVVQEAWSFSAATSGGRGVQLVTGFERAIVDGNRPLLVQLVDNLLRNAIVHNRPTGGTIWVRTGVGRAGGPVLTVTNTGPHVPVTLVATLTEPFVRAQGRTRSLSGPGGSGLGLAIVASVVRAHRAELTVAARPEGGLAVEVQFAVPSRVPGVTAVTVGPAVAAEDGESEETF